jgi:hypothetical protein
LDVSLTDRLSINNINSMRALEIVITILLIGASLGLGAPECVLDIHKLPSPDVTQVWSPLFQAAWDRLNGMQKGPLEEVSPPNPLITQLSGFKWNEKAVMPQDGYGVYAGPAISGFAEETAESIKQKFGVGIDLNDIPIVPQGIASYGILLRDLQFKKKFLRSRNTAMNFRSASGKSYQVAFFGTAGKYSRDYGNYVKVLAYQPDGSSFVLSIETDRDDEALVIYRPGQVSSFQGAIEQVKAAIKSPLAGQYGSLGDGGLHGEDRLAIPYLDLDVSTDFTQQLSGSLHYGGDSRPWRIARAIQLTRFNLSEEGAQVRVDAGASADPFGELPKLVPRRFICDRSFFVFMWKTGAEWPYFAAWIDGGDWLTPFTKE